MRRSSDRLTGRARHPSRPGQGQIHECTDAHAEIQIGDSVVIVEEGPPAGNHCAAPRRAPGSPASLFIYVEDVDAVIARAVELGATLQRPAEDQFYGDRDGHIVDPFGHGWTVASHIEDVTPEELMRRMAELFGSAGS